MNLYIYHFLAMQGEHKVIRLEWHAIAVHASYMMDEMSPDAVVPHLVERRLLSPAEAEEVYEMSDQMKKVSAILTALRGKVIVGRLGTFCAALISAKQSHITKQLTNSECVSQYSVYTNDYILSRVSSPPEG